jgi:hypothetical protein
MTVSDARHAETSAFALPPLVRNARGEVRKAGFELEYAGVSLNLSATLVRTVFGGEHVSDTTFVHRVRGTRYGRFSVEIDTTVLKDKTYEKPLRALGIEPGPGTQWLEKALLTTFATVVPTEIAAPPIPVTELTPLDELRRLLAKYGAKGTRASLLYAFGMHINPEIASDDSGYVRDVLRAFLLMYPWLRERTEVDVTRRISPYINPFPDAYVRLLLDPSYPADTGRLIDDYVAHNPTRNRPLDVLPVLAHLDADRVMARVQDPHLVKPRPAFHYRLPNCMVDEPRWTLAREWNDWVEVEKLAADKEALGRRMKDEG